MDFVWDDEKAAENLGKHGVAFEDAIAAICDPARLDRFDERFHYGEARLQIMGRSANGMILFVVIVEEPLETRIISARKANRREEQAYYARED